jgi:hypothetical protein
MARFLTALLVFGFLTQNAQADWVRVRDPKNLKCDLEDVAPPLPLDRLVIKSGDKILFKIGPGRLLQTWWEEHVLTLECISAARLSREANKPVFVNTETGQVFTNAQWMSLL